MSIKLTAERRDQLQGLEVALGHCFKKPQLLDQALRHRSYSPAGHKSLLLHNERLEFLGDAVLELAISHELMDAHPSFSEGVLSKFRAALVNQKSLAERAQSVALGTYLLLGKGEESCEGRQKASLLSDAYEAVLGAIYLDGGYGKVHEVISRQFKALILQAGSQDFLQDYKTQLQEKVQMLFRTVPKYELHTATGPDHDKLFEVELWVNKEKIASGKGKSKKMAEQAAAYEALQRLKSPRAKREPDVASA